MCDKIVGKVNSYKRECMHKSKKINQPGDWGDQQTDKKRQRGERVRGSVLWIQPLCPHPDSPVSAGTLD